MKVNCLYLGILFSVLITLVSPLPTTLQPNIVQDLDDQAETTTLAFYEVDTEIVEPTSPPVVAVVPVVSSSVAPVQVTSANPVTSVQAPSANPLPVAPAQVPSTNPVAAPAGSGSSSTIITDEVSGEVVVAGDADKKQIKKHTDIRQDDSEPDGDDEEGDDEEEEDQQQQGPPFPPRPPRPGQQLLSSKPGGLYKESANSTRPEKIPTITVQQQLAEAAAKTSTVSPSSSTPEATTTKKYSRIRTTVVTKPTISSIIRRKPSTPATTTAKVLTFAEEWNLTNFFHTHTGPQGRADCECGKVPFKLENADLAGVNVYPWAVAVVRSGIFGGGRPHCGATLINDRYVVTAVHCVLDLYPEDMQVWLTAHNSFQPVDNFVQSDRIVKRNVAEIIMHPNYNRRSHDNDVALLKLGSTVDISSSSYFTPVCLAAADNAYAGLTARVVGWGSSQDSSNRFSNQKLCKEDVPVLSNDVCNRDTVHKDKITGNMMCAGLLTPERNQDCLGDAGSGLTIPNGGRYTLIGVVSWGYQNHQVRVPYSPVVYAKVPGYSDWILHNTRDADWCIV